jgi:hypothetical protein
LANASGTKGSGIKNICYGVANISLGIPSVTFSSSLIFIFTIPSPIPIEIRRAKSLLFAKRQNTKEELKEITYKRNYRINKK